MSELKHYGVLGMKWGHRKKADRINTKDRVLKSGSKLQNISKDRLDTNLKSRHLYTAYTPYDKKLYIDLMGNMMYEGPSFKNTMVAKKDIKIPSDKRLTDTFISIVNKNPKMVSDDMLKAQNKLYFFDKKGKYYDRKIEKIRQGNVKVGEKMAQKYLSLIVSDKTTKSRSEFYGSLVKQGFDAISDVNDRDQGFSQDPLIIINPKKSVKNVVSLKLTEDVLKKYNNYVVDTTFTKRHEREKSKFEGVVR